MKFPYRKVSAITPDLSGFYRIDHEAYHSGLGLSSTRVKKALVSYAQYMQEIDQDSAALAFGRAFHAALLEPDLFVKTHVVMPRFDGHPSSNVYQNAKKLWLETNFDKEIITNDEATDIAEMIRAVRAHPEFKNLPSFDAEIMAINTDPDTGLKIKCKADLFGHAIVDFKTTSSGLQPAEFLNDIVKWKYHVSAAFYQDIVWLCTGERLPFIVVPVTKKAPFECEFYTLDEGLLDEGRKLYKAALQRIRIWETLPDAHIFVDKRMRTLYSNARVAFQSKDILDFIGQK